MLRILGKTILPIIAGYLLSKVDPVESLFAPYLTSGWQLPVLLSATLLVCFLIPYNIYTNKKYKIHTEEQRALFNAAKAVINQRSGISLEQINVFKSLFDEYKYFIKPGQKRLLASLLSDLQDLRLFSEERKGNVSSEERKSLVVKERGLLVRIENAKSTIEKYILELT